MPIQLFKKKTLNMQMILGEERARAVQDPYHIKLWSEKNNDGLVL